MADNRLQSRIKELDAQHGGLNAAARVLKVDAGYLSRLASGYHDWACATHAVDETHKSMWGSDPGWPTEFETIEAARARALGVAASDGWRDAETS